LDEDGALFDSEFDGGGPFRVIPESGGVSLDSALRDFGPAAIDDLIPRVRALAAQLDAAHAAGIVHGALHPNKVIVKDEATYLLAGTASSSPYVAPEVAGGEPPSPASDQFALAAITYEWLFGRRVAGPAERPLEVRGMPGVDRGALSKAFTRALALQPADRFASCAEFCDGLAAAAVPELPLLALDADPEIDAPVDAFDPGHDLDLAAPNPDDVKIVAEESMQTAAQPDFDAFEPRRSDPVRAAEPVAVPSWNPSASDAPAKRGERFGGGALILATIVGAIFGFAAGYMARPRALQSSAPAQITLAPGTEAPILAGKAGEAGKAGKVEERPATPALPAPPARPALGRLLVRSTPSGASVSVDGVAKGVTPLALRDVELGTRSISVTRRGYLPEARKVTISAARPSRSLDVRLAAEAAAAPPRPSTPATLGKPATSTGGLSVDSRPIGAAVTINGKPSGNTPLVLSDLAPGEYRIVMAMPGYRNFATTVRVVAGERVRAAASLTAQEQE
jgi:hypothetical protein